MPGIAGRLKRRRLSRAAKRRCPPGHRCRVDGRPTGRTRGAILVSSHGCRAVERTSGLRGNAPPFAGRRGNLGPSGGSARVRARRSPGARTTRERISASRCRARTTKEVCGTGSRRGLAPPKDGANLCSGRSGPAVPLLRKEDRAARQPVRPREGADEGEGVWRFVTPGRSTRKRRGSW